MVLFVPGSKIWLTADGWLSAVDCGSHSFYFLQFLFEVYPAEGGTTKSVTNSCFCELPDFRGTDYGSQCLSRVCGDTV